MIGKMRTSVPGSIRELMDRETEYGVLDRDAGPWTVTGGLCPADGLVFHTLENARMYIREMEKDGRSDWERWTWDGDVGHEAYSRGNENDWWAIRPFSPGQFLSPAQMKAWKEAP